MPNLNNPDAGLKHDCPRAGKIAHCCEFLESAIRAGEFDASPRLPSIAALARMAGVSRFTMWKAVLALKKDGRITGDRGRRNFVAECVIEPPRSPREVGQAPRRTKTRLICGRIERDILNGRYSPEAPLPTVKELAVLYGAHRDTVRKSLRTLIDESVLRSKGRLLRPAPAVAPGPAGRLRVVLIGYGTDISANITWEYQHREYLRQFEVACAQAGLALDVVCFSRTGVGLAFKDARTGEPTTVGDGPEILGYLYQVSGPVDADEELLRLLARRGKPVAVLDEVGTWPTARLVAKLPSVRIFRNTVSRHPANHVARYLLELGHRTAVYISPYHGTEYSQRRFRGLQQVFAHADARVVPVTASTDGSTYEERGAARIKAAELSGFYGEWRKNIPFAYASALDNMFRFLPSVIGRGREREILDRIFQRALRVDGATAWITVGDSCASYACEFLRNNRIAVPEELSLMSFDDLPEALEKGITSYNFNIPATVSAMLRCIVDPRRFPARKPVVEIEGQIIPRRTTGKPRILLRANKDQG